MDIKRAPQSKKKQYIAWGSGVVAIVLASVFISGLKPAAPTVERATLWVDSVRKGELLREVRAPGTLVPEHIRIIAAVTAGRVEVLPVRPGVTVNPASLLVEMSNTDVQLQALAADQAVTAARGQLASLRRQLAQARLAQEATIAQLRTQIEDANRQIKVVEALDKKGLASASEIAAARDRVTELQTRQTIEQQQLDEMNSSAKEQLQLTEDQVRSLTAIAGEQRNRVRSMHVVAGENGVLLSLPLEVGQWVNPGLELARVAQPGRLKAVLRVPETQARDIAIGQKATIDTRNGVVEGHVMRQDPGSAQGTVVVEIAIDGELPRGARADMSVDGTIELERLPNVMYVGRPAYGSADSKVGLFKVSEDGKEATRITVELGRTSVNTVEIKNGLAVGDSVIISDMSQWDNVSRVRLKR
ncbi:MAG TPA: HlyD family efflux transporter periplasmic adaptor subunit [Gemmatimonadaceae bacterium]|nr:HlyD family efflux transporter periplasmic adaptor subunit [Gemmatimonadaceae bacterium]